MKLTPFLSSGVSANVYLVEGDKKLLVDAGMRSLGLKPDILVLTHCHFDHSAMAKVLQEKGCEVWMGEEEARFFEKDREEASAAGFFGFDYDLDFRIDKRLRDNEIVDFGNCRLKTLLTPGHTPGGICLYDEESKILFSGDTIFADGVGRFDLFGGDLGALKESLKRLSGFKIKELYPGHGPPLKSGVDDYLRRALGPL